MRFSQGDEFTLALRDLYQKGAGCGQGNLRFGAE